MAEEVKQTEFNSNLASLIRLNNVLVDCNRYSRLSNYNELNPEFLNLWKQSILAAYREVYPKLNTTERDKLKKLFNKFRNLSPVVILKKTEAGTTTIVDAKAFNRVWNLCHNTEIRIRDFATQHGMLLRDRQEWDGLEEKW